MDNLTKKIDDEIEILKQKYIRKEKFAIDFNKSFKDQEYIILR